MPELKLYFLGRPHIETDGEALDVSNRKATALLAYLAGTGQRHSRDALAALLWPEHDQTRARANLRRTLWQLNQTTIAEVLDAAQESLGFAAGRLPWTDVGELQAHLESVAPTPSAGPEASARDPLAGLMRAADLYRGDFLADFHLPDSAEFESWAAGLRERLREQLLDALELLAAHAIEADQLPQAQRYARRQVEIDPLREGAYRQLMTALARSGHRSAAFAQFEALRRLLETELGVEPDAETSELFRHIREGALAEPSSHLTLEDDASAAELPTVPAGPLPEPDRLPPSVHEVAANPYRGLFAFREQDAPYFFGRESFVDLLHGMVQRRSLVVVVGPSGSGKSSVVHAGLLAQLRGEGSWRIASFRPGARPFQALAAILLPQLDPELGETERLIETNRLAAALHGGEVALMDVVRRVVEKGPPGTRFALVGDQFEELYTLVSEDALRNRFLDVLTEAVFDQQYRDDPMFSLIPTLRADFLGQALWHRPFADALQDADLKLGPMTRPELGRAIERPAALQRVTFEPGLVTRILDDVGDEPGNLPLLEFALALLWERQRGATFAHDAYDAIERVDGALSRHADAVFAALSPADRSKAQRVFIQVVRPGEGTEDTRRLASHAELGDDAWVLVRRLADARLLVTGRDVEGSETVEVVHEALIRGWGRLRGWMDSDRDFRVWQERLRAVMRQWEASGRDDEALLRGVALSTAEGWLAEWAENLSAAEIDFIRSGVAQRRALEAETRRQRTERERLRRRLTGVLSVGLALAVVLAVVAGLQWRAASRQRDAARLAVSRQLGAQAQNLVEERFDLALLLGVEATRLVPSPESKQVLARIIGNNPDLERFRWEEGEAKALAVSGGGRFLALITDEGIVIVDREEDTRELAAPLHEWLGVERGILSALLAPGLPAVSDDGELLAVVVGSDVRLLELDRGEGTRELKLPSVVAPPRAQPTFQQLAFSPDGSTLAWLSDVGVAFWDVASGQALAVRSFASELRRATFQGGTFDPDGSQFAHGWGNLVLLRSVGTTEVATTLVTDGRRVEGVSFSPDGSKLAAAGSDGSIEYWDVGREERLWRTAEAHQAPIAGGVISPDGHTGYTSDEGGSVLRWDTATGRVIGRLQGLPSVQGPAGLMLLEGGDILSMVAFQGAQDLFSGVQLSWSVTPQLLDRHDQAIIDLVLGGGDSLTSVDDGGTVWRWPFGAGAGSAERSDVQVHDAYPFGQRLSPDARTLVVPLFDRDLVAVWRLGTDGADPHPVELALPGPTLPIAQFVFTPDGRLLVGGGCAVGQLSTGQGACTMGGLWVWNGVTGEPVGTPIIGHPAPVVRVAVSGDGDRLASIGLDSTVRVWDASSGEQLAEAGVVMLAGDPVAALALAPDGGTLLLGDRNGVGVWNLDPAGLTEIAPPNLISESGVTAVTFSSDGRLAAAGSVDGEVLVWEVATGVVYLRDQLSHALAGGGVTVLRFSADGLRLASGGGSGRIALHTLTGSAGLDAGAGVAATVVERACAVVNRNLSEVEWRLYFGAQPYRATCPDLGTAAPAAR